MNTKLKEHYQSIVLILLTSLVLLIGGTQLLKYIFPRTANVSNQVVMALIGDVLDEKNKPTIETQNKILATQNKILERLSVKNDYSVLLLFREFGKMTTAKEVHDRIDYLESSLWNSQLTAFSCVNRDIELRNHLTDKIYIDEVKKALMTRISSY